MRTCEPDTSRTRASRSATLRTRCSANRSSAASSRRCVTRSSWRSRPPPCRSRAPKHDYLVAGALKVNRVDALGLTAHQQRHLGEHGVQMLRRERRLDGQLASELEAIGVAGGVVDQAALLAQLGQ